MAADVVRISYKELETIAHETEQKITQQKQLAAKEDAKKKRDEEREKKRSKRPSRGIYQPPILVKHHQQTEQDEDAEPEVWETEDVLQSAVSVENWAEEVVDTDTSSKENSVEKELESVSAAIRSLQMSSTVSNKEQKTASNEGRRRSKRPEIQRYVPRGKILEQQQVEDDPEREGESETVASPVGHGKSGIHSPSPQPSQPSPHTQAVSPAVRKIDLKNMQVTVMNEPSVEANSVRSPPTDSRAPASKASPLSKASGTGGQTVSSPQTPQNQAAAHSKQAENQSGNQRVQTQGKGQGRRYGPKDKGFQRSKVDAGETVERDGKRHDTGQGRAAEKGRSQQTSQDLYIVPSRPHTIGQEADRDDTIGKEDVKAGENDAVNSDQSMVNRFSKYRPSKNKSKSYDRLNKSDKWDEEGFYPDPSKMETLVFERSRSSEQLNLSGRNMLKPPMPRGSSAGKASPKKYPFAGVRRHRADSFSSDVSTGTGSDWSTEDLDWDKDVDSKILDWDQEVERELALQVQDETHKLNEWFQQQELGLSQNKGNYATDPSAEKSNTLPFDSRHKKKHVDETRGRRKERRRGSFDVRSRDSSVASVASVQSVQSAYSSDGRRRRRRRRKSSRGSAYSEKLGNPSAEPRNMNIKVTCAKDNKREVKVDAGQEQGRRRDSNEKFNRGKEKDYSHKEKDSAREHGNRKKETVNRDRDQVNVRKDRSGAHRELQRSNSKEQEPFYPRENPRERWGKGDRGKDGKEKLAGRKDRIPSTGSNTEQSGSSPKGGGLIHIPASSTTPEPPASFHGQQRHHQEHPHPHQPHSNPHTQPHYRGMGRGKQHSGSGQKTLFDPNNPSKPIVISEPTPKLEFKDTDDPQSMSPQSPHYPPPEMFGPRGYPRPPGPFFPPGYGYRFPPADPHFLAGPPGPFMHPGPRPEMMYYGYPVQARDSTLFQDDTYARDPYYHEGYDQEQVIAGRSRSQNRMMAEHLLREGLPLDKQLCSLVARRIGGENTLHMIHQLRREVQVRLEQVILLDPDLANKQNVEQIIWKSVFHQMVELFRRQMTEEKDEDAKLHLGKVLEEGNSFYETLLQKLQSTFNFKLDAFLDSSSLPPDTLSRTVKLALLSAQRTMICLGDIARYREQSMEVGKVNYAKARSWYTKAQQIAPKNGRPYNQLAILALYTRRKLDAVYYYMRSLAASNPFITARESLMSLFDEARKKAEDAEKKRSAERMKHQKTRVHRHTTDKHRVEVWVKGDGTSSENDVNDNFDEDLSKINAAELNKRFVLSFLHVHGKLFTKIGMETFAESCGQMLQEFSVLCQDNAISPSRFLQLMVINMFAIENTALKDTSLESTCRSLLQEHAVQLGLDMFGILVNQCSEQLEQHLQSADYPGRMFSRELEELVPSVKVWTDWMICHADLWNPPPAVRDPSMGPEIDVWASTARLCNRLKDMDTSHAKFQADRKEGFDAVILSEDTMMSGFVPLLSTPLNNTFVHNTVDREVAGDCLRIEKLRVFGEYLCGIEPPMLAYNVEVGQYYSVAPSEGYGDADQLELAAEEQESSDTEDLVIESEEEIVDDGEGEDHVHKLRVKREELKKKMQEKAKQQENIKNMLEKNRHRSIELEIRPIFLVPDTNCFIDHLPSLQKLIEDKHYTVVIPLVVINELDGLAQGRKIGHFESDEHASKVKSRARATVEFLEQEFEKKHTHLKALTAKGTVLETIAFRSEDTDVTGNNDDVILSCSLHYCTDKARDFMPKDKDSPVRLYRDVVLLTDDRNLRLKAHTHNVPVKDVPSFMAWSGVK